MLDAGRVIADGPPGRRGRTTPRSAWPTSAGPRCRSRVCPPSRRWYRLDRPARSTRPEVTAMAKSKSLRSRRRTSCRGPVGQGPRHGEEGGRPRASWWPEKAPGVAKTVAEKAPKQMKSVAAEGARHRQEGRRRRPVRSPRPRPAWARRSPTPAGPRRQKLPGQAKRAKDKATEAAVKAPWPPRARAPPRSRRPNGEVGGRNGQVIREVGRRNGEVGGPHGEGIGQDRGRHGKTTAKSASGKAASAAAAGAQKATGERRRRRRARSAPPARSRRSRSGWRRHARAERGPGRPAVRRRSG